LRDPRRLPAGLPERPFSNGRPRCFCCFCRKSSALINFFSAEILAFQGRDDKKNSGFRPRYAVLIDEIANVVRLRDGERHHASTMRDRGIVIIA
jgi:hypothetical protein